ncbi:MAG: M15 family metallopeptidase [Halobacteriovoraceae bacterium]|nr:M15 family metallopeptidase [Halobacteriovoraceae bacterium]
MKLLSILTFFLISHIVHSRTCTYEYKVWNRWKGKSENLVKIKKKYKDLEKREKGPFGCTPCLEDQQKITLSNGVTFLACKKKADDIQAVLETSLSEGFRIRSVLGYRPQMSKGKLDSKGFRTKLSLHSYGIAIDVNRKSNGLYDQCVRWEKDCRLIQGGVYNPKNPLSIKKNSTLVKIMKQIGMKWGGDIRGRQKDFMHFSPSGY